MPKLSSTATRLPRATALPSRHRDAGSWTCCKSLTMSPLLSANSSSTLIDALPSSTTSSTTTCLIKFMSRLISAGMLSFATFFASSNSIESTVAVTLKLLWRLTGNQLYGEIVLLPGEVSRRDYPCADPQLQGLGKQCLSAQGVPRVQVVHLANGQAGEWQLQRQLDLGIAQGIFTREQRRLHLVWSQRVVQQRSVQHDIDPKRLNADTQQNVGTHRFAECSWRCRQQFCGWRLAY